MSYRSVLEITQSDYGYDIEGMIVDEAGAAIDLTGCTLKMIVYNQKTKSTILQVNPSIVLPATDGKWKYTVQTNDFVIPGTYKVEVEVVRTSPPAVVTAKGGTIVVSAEAIE